MATMATPGLKYNSAMNCVYLTDDAHGKKVFQVLLHNDLSGLKFSHLIKILCSHLLCDQDKCSIKPNLSLFAQGTFIFQFNIQSYNIHTYFSATWIYM